MAYNISNSISLSGALFNRTLLIRMAPEMMTIKNNPNISGWTADDGYANGFNKTDYPIRVFNSKPVSGLTVLMKTLERDLNYLCQGGLQGYKVFLSPPGEVLRSPRYTAPVPLSELAVVAIKPTLFISSKALRSYDPIKRQCFFNSERQLSFLRFYTQRNCEAECLANFTLKECGCVKFSMPSKYEVCQCSWFLFLKALPLFRKKTIDFCRRKRNENLWRSKV